MVAAITVTPASGSVIHAKSVCRIDVTGAAANTLTGYSTSVYPTSPELRYYLLIDAPAGVDDGRSYVFAPSSDGKHTYNNYTFPAAGSYTVRLRNAGDDSDAATLSVTVS